MAAVQIQREEATRALAGEIFRYGSNDNSFVISQVRHSPNSSPQPPRVPFPVVYGGTEGVVDVSERCSGGLGAERTGDDEMTRAICVRPNGNPPGPARLTVHTTDRQTRALTHASTHSLTLSPSHPHNVGRVCAPPDHAQPGGQPSSRGAGPDYIAGVA